MGYTATGFWPDNTKTKIYVVLDDCTMVDIVQTIYNWWGEVSFGDVITTLGHYRTDYTHNEYTDFLVLELRQ